MKKTALATSILFALPFVAFAQSLVPIRNLISAVNGIVATLIPLMIALALVAFFWGLVKYLYAAKGDPKGGDAAKQLMIWGLVALFVMVSVWGIITLAQQALGVSGNTTVPIPMVPTS
jgi:hypothetical protein